MTDEKDVAIEHGTLTAYTKQGCRCARCRDFWNAYMRWWRAERRGRLHGACPSCTCPLPEKPERSNRGGRWTAWFDGEKVGGERHILPPEGTTP